MELLKKATARFPNVEVDYFRGAAGRLCQAAAGPRGGQGPAGRVRLLKQVVQMAGHQPEADPRSGDHVPGLQREIYIPELHHRQGDGPVRGRPGEFLPREIVDDVKPENAGTAGKEGLTMASGVEELLDMLFDMVDEAKNVPLSSDRCMIEAGPGPGPDRRHPGSVPGGTVRGAPRR